MSSPRLELLAMVAWLGFCLLCIGWVDVLGAAWAAGALP